MEETSETRIPTNAVILESVTGDALYLYCNDMCGKLDVTKLNASVGEYLTQVTAFDYKRNDEDRDRLKDKIVELLDKLTTMADRLSQIGGVLVVRKIRDVRSSTNYNTN